MTRKEQDARFTHWALRVAEMSKCKWRTDGCVLVDRWYKIASLGFNRLPLGMLCDTCPTGGEVPCDAMVHAVDWAIQRIQRPIMTCYVTTEPCKSCTEALLKAECRRVVFLQQAPEGSSGRELWRKENDAGSWEYWPNRRRR